ncbi:MAG: glycoside hydrolase family 26 protein [Solirubrobacterales bacterium]
MDSRQLRSLLVPILLLALAFSFVGGVDRAPAKKALGMRGRIGPGRSLGKKRKAVRRGAARGSLYWGALVGEQINGRQVPWDMGGADQLEAMLGKRMSLIHFMAPFAQCSGSRCSYYRFPAEEMEAIRDHGAIPFFSWSSQSIPSRVEEPDFQLSDVIAGRYDAYIRAWAREARAWGHPFFLRFDWEMNGDWFPWGEGANGNRRGESVAAWRHVHDIFTAVGATNVTWVWCPNVDFGDKLAGLASLYPGDAYVDWTCLDGYNSGTNPAKPDRWRSFDELYARTYREVAGEIAPSKPMAIGEIASTEQGGSKARWLSEMLDALPVDYPKIHALVYFDKFDSGMDWPLETSRTALAAFAAGLQDPAYVSGGGFSSFDPPGPIPPPRG